MKKLFIVISIAAISLTSCEDFLEEEIKSNVTAEDFYVTSEGYNALINSNYSSLREIYGQDPWLFMAGTDLYMEGRNPEPPGLSQYTQLTSSENEVEFLYEKCYVAIQRANTAIYYADITEQTSNISQYLGEVKFIRANAFFLLVQTYGGVSLVTEKFDEVVVSFDRNSAEEIYSFIISELEEAYNLVSDGAFIGRVNQRAVENLLAKVHLTRAYEPFAASDDFSKAAQYADNVIGGQTLNLSFEELWTPGNELNEEVIFSVQFDEKSISSSPTTLGHQQQNFFGSYLGGSEVAGDAPYKSYNLCPTRHALSLFEEGDERWEGTFMTEIYERYYNYFDVEDKSSLNVVHFYEPSWFTSIDSTAYVIANPGVEYHSFGDHDPEGGDISGNHNTIIIKKFDDPKSRFAADGSNRSVSTRDFIVSRLAETYLVAAEAYLGAGAAGTGLERLNEVRRRAGVADATLAEFDLDYILDERARELMGEYKRWFDLKRTGKLVERASLYHPLIEESNFNGSNGELKILRPIPQRAIDLNQNPNFEQNPAYQ
ncbi:RagB/SusD family nutrient uptake outer membrane protein [Marinigracilibium pacificum]|uniref:RagB/SusD family nutrient uptake outer membrane protein n=1 Tax=Marinigracilibium pacificum TaxID=2729599 RepID=A0A848J5Q6_9BACT|nr:RagB/SusD family nutrient uptake outer membrane protein [Marinigracilibium pacificum]NMM49699.1 RagB/SusD family nutrient uptake outer membrane protein [Marinigracilibium pacificum]